MPSFFKTALILVAGVSTLSDAKACPPLGPVFPAPQSLSKSDLVKDAASKLRSGLDEQASRLLNKSAVSIGVKSIHEDDLIFNYHFTPPTTTGLGVSEVNESTIYRIASGTKLFTVLSTLQASNVNLDDSIVKYLPQLRNATSGRDGLTAVSWEDVTVGSLASHLSGMGPDLAQDLGIVGSEPWAKAGLPQFAKGSGPDCSGLPGTGTPLCTNKDLLEQVGRRPFVYAPYTSPVYSNIGISMLGLVVEAATKKPINEVIKEGILDVVGMEDTYIGEVPPTEEMFVPEGDAIWNSTLGVFDSAGGMYSNVVDMLAFAEAILSNKLLSPAATRKWLKPATSTSSWGYLVGHPWEILRSDNLTSDGRLIDIYTKSGDLGLYHSLTVLIPDYDVVISILMGGEEVSQMSAPTIILSSVLEALLPAVEAVGRADAEDLYTGVYEDEDTNSTISFTTDSGPGLVITDWQVRGFNVLNHTLIYSIASLETLLSGKDVEPRPVDARVYPTNIRHGKQMAFRGIFDVVDSEARASLESRIFFKNGTCLSMFEQDKMVYNYLSLDEFVFVSGDKGEIKSVRSPGFNVTMTKVSSFQDGDGSSSDAQPPVTGSARTIGTNMVLATSLATLLVFISVL